MPRSLKLMIVKRTLTYGSITSFWLLIIFSIVCTSCDIEPSKAQTLDELHSIFEKWCPYVQITDISRQGAFHEDETGRHRFYRVIAQIDNERSCDLPDQISLDTEPTNQLLNIDRGTYELTLFLDYKSDAKIWKLQKIIIQLISSKSK